MTLLFNDISIFSPNDVIGVFYNGVDGITCGGSTVYDGTGIFNIAACLDRNNFEYSSWYEETSNINM